MSLHGLRYPTASRCSFPHVHCLYLTACRCHPALHHSSLICFGRVSLISVSVVVWSCSTVPSRSFLFPLRLSLFAGPPPPPHNRILPYPQSPLPTTTTFTHDPRLPHTPNMSMNPSPTPRTILPCRLAVAWLVSVPNNLRSVCRGQAAGAVGCPPRSPSCCAGYYVYHLLESIVCLGWPSWNTYIILLNLHLSFL